MSTLKTIKLLMVLFSCIAIHAQDLSINSHVDSLIAETRQLVSEQSFEKAIYTIQLAEELSKTKDPVLYARCLYNHGRAYLYALEYSKAIPFFEQALEIQEIELGRMHADFAYSLTGLANSLRELGQYEKAKRLYEESKDIRKEVLGLNHPSYASAVNNLAILHWEMGEFEITEELLLETKRIRFETYGSDHEEYGFSLYNLAILYNDMGFYKRAENLLLESISIIESKLGTENPDYASALQNLATVYINTGEYEEAEGLYLKSMAIWEKVYGSNNENYHSFQSNLAELYLKMNQIQKAEDLFKEIIDNQDSLQDRTPHFSALALYNLGSFYWDTKQYEKSTPIFEECKSLMAENLGEQHPDYSILLNSLAEAYEIETKYEPATELLKEASKLQQDRLLNAVSFLSENELAKYINVFESDLFRILNILEKRDRDKQNNSDIAALCFDNLLFYKGFLLTAARQINSLSNSTPIASELNNQLIGFRRLLSKAYASPKIYRDSLTITEIENKVNKLEKELAGEVIKLNQINKQFKWQDLRENLQKNEVAIEFIHYNSHPHDENQSIKYAAVLINASHSQPQFIHLFDEKELLDILNAHAEPNKASFNKMYTRGTSVLSSTNQEGLYDLLWEPLMKYLDDIELIHYSPSGLLHRISFEAIHVKENQHLTDLFELIRSGSTSSSVLSENQTSITGQEATLYGGIHYDLDRDRSHSSEESWLYLEGTQKEISEISEILKANGFNTNVKSKTLATEESFKELDKNKLSPRILHIATHGYFYPKPKLLTEAEKLGKKDLPFKNSNHPLIRSGLLLAGANDTWSGLTQKESIKEDGVLTAYEISQMDLSNTELVVLSACETGLGDILGNEGVYGLQRALKIASAQNLIISLWKVPDEETSLLMQSFYSYWLKDKLSIRESLKKAQQDLRDSDYDPYYWAGFILLE